MNRINIIKIGTASIALSIISFLIGRLSSEYYPSEKSQVNQIFINVGNYALSKRNPKVWDAAFRSYIESDKTLALLSGSGSPKAMKTKKTIIGIYEHLGLPPLDHFEKWRGETPIDPNLRR